MLLGLVAVSLFAVKPNRLSREKSPYLLQHKDNPVDWYPWGEEAFARARRENKPILLSIGYSTCHWCHVMEKESFEDPETARVMNENLISIKVDREERPDVDKIYMTAVQIMTGQGGWPLNVFLTPELKPFFGGTYFPPSAMWGRPGWKELVMRIAETWRDEAERKKILLSSGGLSEALKKHTSISEAGKELDSKWLKSAFEAFHQDYDSALGGFGGAPKFPMPVNIGFLLRCYARMGEKEALEMCLNTLTKMSEGGIYDQIGGGFHRYSTDERWHIPHFEKMLYDNSQIAMNFLEAYQITREKHFARVAQETLDYILRDMTHGEGGFYSAEDADSLSAPSASEKKEGAFYVWEKDEILKILGKEAGELFSSHFGVEESGNAASDPQGEFTGKNILYIARSISETAKKFGKSDSEIERVLAEAKKKLFEARGKRPRPHLDDKILTSWNGLMISAFAKGYQALGEERYLKAALAAALFIQKNLYGAKEKRLYRRWRENEKAIFATSDDYAFLVQGLLDLYEASFDSRWLLWALELTEEQNKLFYDEKEGGFFMTAPGHDENLIARVKEDVDNVEPSASSVAVLNLLRLSWVFPSHAEKYRGMAEKTLSLFGSRMASFPRALPAMLVALDFALSKPKQIVISGGPNSFDTKAMMRVVHEQFIPNKILLLADQSLASSVPFLKGLSPVNGKATAYVCENFACKLPTNDVRALAQQLDEGRSK